MTPREIGLVLAALRKARGLTQGQIAKSMKVTQSHLSRLESAQLPLFVDTLQRWCEAVDADLDISITPRKEKT